MISPIKCEILYNKYVSSGMKKTKNMIKEERFACESNLSQENISKLVLVIFSDFSNILYSEDLHHQVLSFFQKNDIIIPPFIIYWNTSNKISNSYVPIIYPINRAFVFSGDSTSFISFFGKLSESNINEMNTYSFITNFLNQPRYNIMDSYFLGLLQS
jgi:hypothetical protein